MGKEYGEKRKIRYAAVVAGCALLAAIAIIGVIHVIKQRNTEAKRVDNILEQGYLWEAEDTEKYVCLLVTFPESVTEIPSVTVTSQKHKDESLDGVSVVSGNKVKYTAPITEGNWTAAVSCAGCGDAEINLRVEEDDQFICRTLALTVQEEAQETTQESDVINDVLNGVLNIMG